ncbi:MAG: hypothetical protein KBH45_07675 [Verrucomicrobia bacterium]|nr:hypothetical protein [Verrucomicrobiota bacterium]
MSRKNQISRAQCRVKNGTPGAGSGAEAEAEIAAGAVMGKVHATSVGAGIDRLVCDRAGTMVTGTDSGSVAVGVTQQSI